MKRFSALIFFISIFSSCAMGPLNGDKTARTLQEGKFGIETGFSPAPYGQVSYGITDDWQVGASLELQLALVQTLNTKYALIQKDEGWSIALAGGAFTAPSFVDTSGIYAGPVFSYKKDLFESYLGIRHNFVNWDVNELEQEDRNDLLANVDTSQASRNFTYTQTTLGVNLWINNNFALNLNGKILHFHNRGFESTINTFGFGVILNSQ